jgi:hypothetical protein
VGTRVDTGCVVKGGITKGGIPKGGIPKGGIPINLILPLVKQHLALIALWFPTLGAVTFIFI